jgi:hypothetical protein
VLDSKVVFASGYGRRATLLLAGIFLAWSSCHAVLFKDASDPSYNTNAPTGGLTNSGWQYEGLLSSGYLATPIAPTFFLAAKHVGGTVGDVFTLNGFTYHTTAMVSNPSADLVVWQVAETFPQYAPLYTASNETGKLCVVFGNGAVRGNQITVGGQLKGWQWGTTDYAKRWGENIVTNVYTDPTLGELLRATFDRNGITNECQLSVNDSSGGMFIQDGATWKLAGINYSVSNPFISTNGVNGSGFNAALLDYGGVYVGGDGNWQLITNQVADIPASFYSTRISSHAAWINSVINFLPGNDLRITAVAKVGNNIQISFATGATKIYSVERRDDLNSGSWTSLTNGVVGTGSVMTVPDVGAANLPKRFYRVVLVP